MNGNLFLFASVATTKTTHGTTTPFKPRSLISTAAASSNVTIFHVSYWYRLLPLDNSAEKPTDGSNRSSHVRAIVSSLNVWVTTSVPTESVTPSILVLSLPLSLSFWFLKRPLAAARKKSSNFKLVSKFTYHLFND